LTVRFELQWSVAFCTAEFLKNDTAEWTIWRRKDKD